MCSFTPMLGVMLAQSVRAMSYLAAGPGEGAGRVIHTLCALPGGVPRSRARAHVCPFL